MLPKKSQHLKVLEFQFSATSPFLLSRRLLKSPSPSFTFCSGFSSFLDWKNRIEEQDSRRKVEDFRKMPESNRFMKSKDTEEGGLRKQHPRWIIVPLSHTHPTAQPSLREICNAQPPYKHFFCSQL